jgi:hypothetical protein
MWVSNARVEVLPGALMKIQVIWFVMLCHWTSSSCTLNNHNVQAFQEDEVAITFECQELLPKDTVTNQKTLLRTSFVSCQVTVLIFLPVYITAAALVKLCMFACGGYLDFVSTNCGET